MPSLLLAAALTALLQFDGDVRREFWTLLEAGRYGWTNYEAAAFVVWTGDRVRLEPWPRATEPHGAMWKGPFPTGTIAIVHTHPNRAPRPSAIDVRTAARTRLPVYVVTRGRITVTDGDGVYTVTRGQWRPGV